MFKSFFGNYFGFTTEINRLHAVLGKNAENIKYWHEKAEKLESELHHLQEFEELKKPVDIPSAEITHSRQILVSEKKYAHAQIDIRNFVMPDFAMKKSLKEKNLVYGEQDLDELIPKVYHLAKTGYKYGADKEYGFDEYWMFPFELQASLGYGKAGDCDDWSNLIGSYFAAAGIPRNRWLISCGMARAGYGHSTVYAKDETGTWRHLNSTKPEYKSAHLSGYPSNKDKNDKAGIKPDGFWYSYNDKFSLHEFESEESESAFDKTDKRIWIKVEK